MSEKVNQHRCSLTIDDLDFFMKVGTVAPPIERIKELRSVALKVKKFYNEVYIDWLPDGTFEVRNKKFEAKKEDVSSVPRKKKDKARRK